MCAQTDQTHYCPSGTLKTRHTLPLRIMHEQSNLTSPRQRVLPAYILQKLPQIVFATSSAEVLIDGIVMKVFGRAAFARKSTLWSVRAQGREGVWASIRSAEHPDVALARPERDEPRRLGECDMSNVVYG